MTSAAIQVNYVPVTYREVRPDDESFIYSSWLKSFRASTQGDQLEVESLVGVDVARIVQLVARGQRTRARPFVHSAGRAILSLVATYVLVEGRQAMTDTPKPDDLPAKLRELADSTGVGRRERELEKALLQAADLLERYQKTLELNGIAWRASATRSF